MSDTQPIFSPDKDAMAGSQLAIFMGECESRFGAPIDNAQVFHEWTCQHSNDFWSHVIDSAGIVCEGDLEPALVLGADPLQHSWFPNVRLNYAENLFGHGAEQACAVVAYDEHGKRRSETFHFLKQSASRVAYHLQALAIDRQSVVAGVLPNTIAAVSSMLGATWLGAAWTSASPDFGEVGLLDRFGQSKPSVLFAVGGYSYGGKWFDTTKKVRQVIAQLEQPCVVVWCDDTVALSGEHCLQHWIENEAAPIPDFERVPFDHPLFILYSSGTTGLPKCIVHGVGGTLVQHAKEQRLHTDIRSGEVVFYYTTCGWMMWNWLVSVLATGATIVLFDGSPMCRSSLQLMELVDREHIAVFGTSAKYIEALSKAEERPADACQLKTLRAILSTGSPLSADLFQYCVEHIQPNVQVASISGGTDIVSCFVLGHPLLPVYPGEIQSPGLGMAVTVFDDAGTPCQKQSGELVCTNPFPSRPLCFLNDEGGERYRESYYSRFSGVWCQGDFAEVTETGGFVIHGRSDTVLNPGGVRIGTAEIYRLVDTMSEVKESVVIGYPVDGDVAVVLFVVLSDQVDLSESLEKTIRQRLRDLASPRHVPRIIIAVDEIPRTRSGKISEVAVRKIVLNQVVSNTHALSNAHALDSIRERFLAKWNA